MQKHDDAGRGEGRLPEAFDRSVRAAPYDGGGYGTYGDFAGPGPVALPDHWDGRHAQRDYQAQWSTLAGERDSAGRARRPQRGPDYEQWRNEQMRRLDEDYEAFRRERYERFAREFESWREARARPAAEQEEPEPQSPGAKPLAKTQQQQR